MTDEEFDALLRRALEDNIRAEYPDVFDPNVEFPPPPFSPRYLRWEKKLLADPVGFARKQARPIWKKALRAAACFLLCAATVLGAMLALSPSARAWVTERAVYWTDSFTKFKYISTEGVPVSETWRPAYIPEGFEETDVDWTEEAGYLRVTYENPDGKLIYITSMPAGQNGSINVDNEHSDYYDIEINGQPASLFISNTEGYPSYLIWSNADMTTMFLLSTNYDYDILIPMAESGP